MDAVLKTLMQEIERTRSLSGHAYAMGDASLGRKYLHIADGLERAYKILISEMVGAK